MSLVLTIVNAWRPSFSRLQETADFGSNPGALRMLTFLPDNLSPRPALVVVLHGSMQSAADYDRGAGWSTLADQYGFALLMPEQSRQNNLTRSFNWFELADTQREKGEAHSIMQMVEQMVSDHHIDRTRIFVTGLSAGGAMTLAMLASYPEVFAAGAVIAGLPYGTATNAQEALRSMFQAPPKSSRELGDLVREASPNTAVWPRLSVWHGSADRTVKPSNAGEIIKQWLNVHELPLTPMSEQIVDGQSRQVWWNTDGKTVIESFTITDMAHGTPISSLGSGIAGPCMIEAGISSSDHIAKFFGLDEPQIEAPAKTTKRRVPLFEAKRLCCVDRLSRHPMNGHHQARAPFPKCAMKRLMHRKTTSLLDDLVGPDEQRRRHGESNRLGGLEVDRQFEFGRLMVRNIAGICAAQDGVDVVCDNFDQPHEIIGMSHQTADVDELPKWIQCRNFHRADQIHDEGMVHQGIRVITDHDGICALAQTFRDGLAIGRFASRKLEQRNIESNARRIGSRAHRRTLDALPRNAQGEKGEFRHAWKHFA